MRECKLGVVVGKKGIGKTYITTKIIEQYTKGFGHIKPRRALIIDVNDEYENIKAISLKDVVKFSVHPTIEARRVRPFSDDGQRWTLGEVVDALFYVLENLRNSLLLLEDINRYLSDNLPNDVIGAICTNRHTDTDIIIHLQALGRITPKIWQNLNWVRFHKNSDSVDRHERKFPEKYEMLKLCELIINDKYYHKGEKHCYLTIECDEEKIYGSYTKEELEKACEEYIGLNYNKVVAPIVKKSGWQGKTKTAPKDASIQAKKLLVEKYSTI